MLGMTRWTPWTELAGLHRDLDSIVGRVFGEAVPRRTRDRRSNRGPGVDRRAQSKASNELFPTS